MDLNVTEHGVVADPQQLNTQALQQCIDQCHDHGGGVVRVPAGRYLTGTLCLKSHVTLRLEAGAVLRASPNLADFPNLPSPYPGYDGTLFTHRMLIYAENAEQVTIEGCGTLDGGGDNWRDGPFGGPSFSLRPRILYFRHCTGVRIRDIHLVNGASWIQTYQSCRDVVIRGITVDSRENADVNNPNRFADHPHRNTDGLDVVDSQDVRISDCFIRAGDDGICLKSLSPDEGCRDITITNCVVTTHASGIKIGTESAGAFEDIVISNCTIYDTFCEGIALITTDGARLERVTVSNISLRNIKGGAVFIHLGNRNRLYGRAAAPRTGVLRDVILQNIQGTRLAAAYGCLITGCPDARVERVLLENIMMAFDGGIREAPSTDLPEIYDAYPSARAMGTLPAYGLVVRHARDVTFSNVRVRTLEPDVRPSLWCSGVEDLHVRNSPELTTP